MEWTFDETKNEWNYFFDKEIIAKIKIIEKLKNKIYKYSVKTFFSSILISKHKTEILTKKNMSWQKQTLRKFKTLQDLNTYLYNKKKALDKKFIQMFR